MGWPPGVARLLEAGADVDAMDKLSQNPLLYACSGSCFETVHRLLVRGSALRSHLNQGHSIHVRLALEVALKPCRWYRSEIIQVIIEALSDRRKQLLELAVGMLSADRLMELQVAKGQTLDERASDVYDALTGISSVIPIALYSHSRELGTVFHIYQHDAKIADQLYNAGFRDIEGYNALGLTPLMVLDLYSLFAGRTLSNGQESCIFSWLLSKGASLLTVQRNSHWCALHYIGARLGIEFAKSWDSDPYYLASGWFESQCIDEIYRVTNHYGTLPLVTQASDHCSCACSSAGCTITISMLKEFSSRIRRPMLGKPMGSVKPRFCLIDFWLPIVGMDFTLESETIAEILRFILFGKLGLTHTCCWFNYDSGYDGRSSKFMGKSPEYGRMIQEEEADIIRDLEGLLDLALSQWLDFEGSISDFIEGFIANELNFDPKDWDDNYKREVEDLGVKLDRAPVDQAGPSEGKLCKACEAKYRN